MTPPRRLPTALAGWLIVQIVLAAIAGLLIYAMSLMFSDARTPAGDYLLEAGIAVAPLLIALVVGIATRALWQGGLDGAAYIVAFLPIILALPLLVVVTGFAP